MKKIKFITIILVCILLMTSGCGKEEKKTKESILECTRNITKENITIDLKYTITYQGNYVQKLVNVNKIISTKNTDLNAYKERLEGDFEPHKGMDNEIKIDNNTLTGTTTIDYSKIDTDKLLNVDSGYSEPNKAGKIKLSPMEDLYANVGMTCKKK